MMNMTDMMKSMPMDDTAMASMDMAVMQECMEACNACMQACTMCSGTMAGMDGMERGDYDILLSTDSGEYGGFERIDAPFSIDESGLLRGALSERTAVALKRKEKA